MGKRDFIGGGKGIELIDVNGSFARCIKNAPKLTRKALNAPVAKTVEHMADEMFDNAPPRSAAPPHVKDAIDYEVRGLTGKVGILKGEEPAAEGDVKTTMGEVALYNEYRPNAQPFMRPAAEKEASQFIRRATAAIAAVERELSGGL